MLGLVSFMLALYTTIVLTDLNIHFKIINKILSDLLNSM